jgi:hypothetical protein
MAAQIKNASQLPKFYYAKHMQPGTVKYDDGIYLVDTDLIKNMAPSGNGVPVYVQHIDGDVDLKRLKEDADGYVTESFYNELDGWAWFKFIAVDDRAHEAIKKGWSVSNAHLPTQYGRGGSKNNVPYIKEVLNSDYTHLAIVPDPRYEGACIMTPDEFKSYQESNRNKLNELRNSKEKKPMLKFFKNEKKEVSGEAIDMDTEVDLGNGETATLGQMAEALQNAKKAAKKIKVGDEEMTVDELVNSFQKMNKKAKKNAEEDEDMENSDDDEAQKEEGDDEIGTDKKNKKAKKNKAKKNEADEDMENEADEDEKDKKDNKKAKKNSTGDDTEEVEVDDKYFETLQNAHKKDLKRESVAQVMVSVDQVQRGKDRYGSVKK